MIQNSSSLLVIAAVSILTFSGCSREQFNSLNSSQPVGIAESEAFSGQRVNLFDAFNVLPGQDTIRVRLFPILRVPGGEPFPISANPYDIEFRFDRRASVEVEFPDGSRQSFWAQTSLRVDSSQGLRIQLDGSGGWISASQALRISIEVSGSVTRTIWDRGLATETARDFRGNFVVERTVHSVSASGRTGCRPSDARNVTHWSALNVVSVQDYLKSVVPSEVFPDWPVEALSAQAIAARAYALRHRAIARSAAQNRNWDVDPTTCFQSYRGTTLEKPLTTQAVQNTDGLIVSYRGEVVETLFSAHSGGYVASALDVFGNDVPYLPAQPDVGGVRERSIVGELGMNAAVWRRSAAFDSVREWLQVDVGWRAPGSQPRVEVWERNSSQRVLALSSNGTPVGASRSEQVNHRDQFRRRFNLRNTFFNISEVGGGLEIEGYGHGHGVGMSQWGTFVMASQGATFRQILSYYYPGTTIERR